MVGGCTEDAVVVVYCDYADGIDISSSLLCTNKLIVPSARRLVVRQYMAMYGYIRTPPPPPPPPPPLCLPPAVYVQCIAKTFGVAIWNERMRMGRNGMDWTRMDHDATEQDGT